MEAPAVKKLSTGVVAALLAVLDLLAVLVLASTATWEGKKLRCYGLTIGITLLLTRAHSDLYARSYLCSVYVRTVVAGGAALRLFGMLITPRLLDRRMYGLYVYTLAISQSSLQEEMTLTIYRHRFMERVPESSEFLDNGYGTCKPKIGGAAHDLRITIDCD